MLDSDCTNACALNGLPGPMRHWFTTFCSKTLQHPVLLYSARLFQNIPFLNIFFYFHYMDILYFDFWFEWLCTSVGFTLRALNRQPRHAGAKSKKTHGYPAYPVFFSIRHGLCGKNHARSVAVLSFYWTILPSTTAFCGTVLVGHHRSLLSNDFMDKYCAT